MAKSDERRIHPYIPKLVQQLEARRVDRREFLRTATLLGLSASAAYGIVGRVLGESAIPRARAQGTPKQGGIFRVGMEVQKMEDPATYSWTQMSNQTRHVAEYLAITGPDNVTRPMLAESWEASDDLKTWTFHLRQGVYWHNGDEFVADHVVWNFERWVDPAVASSNSGLSTFASMEGVEAVDKHTVRLHLNKPVLSAPEDCYNYPTAILHPSFEPPFSDNPIGTGPYTLSELVVGERCILKRITETTNGQPFKYWGGDVYLDEIHYYHFDADNQLTAFASGEVDSIYQFGIEQYEFAQAIPGQIVSARTAQTVCCRFHVQEEPFNNKKLREAIVKATDNSAYKDFVFQGQGDIGENHHVAPVHPEYFQLPPLQRDVEAARALLAEAGYPNGIDLTLDVGNTDGPWHQTLAELWRDQLKDAGINLNINVMPASRYWEIWTQTPFGITAWTHRPLGTMALSLAYRTGVPWNESQYSNPEFEAALDDAEATLDVEERRAKMEKVEKILQDDAVMVQPVWRPVFTMITDQVKDYPAHPTQYHQFNKVWLDT
ncbi:MAG TPA: ABC transporter substrate-binding protein [Geminicoccaceae bacterium]|nr:ABC transporter substrate-binding protein [Geminicoccaceae bacterium]